MRHSCALAPSLDTYVDERTKSGGNRSAYSIGTPCHSSAGRSIFEVFDSPTKRGAELDSVKRVKTGKSLSKSLLVCSASQMKKSTIVSEGHDCSTLAAACFTVA